MLVHGRCGWKLNRRERSDRAGHRTVCQPLYVNAFALRSSPTCHPWRGPLPRGAIFPSEAHTPFFPRRARRVRRGSTPLASRGNYNHRATITYLSFAPPLPN